MGIDRSCTKTCAADATRLEVFPGGGFSVTTSYLANQRPSSLARRGTYGVVCHKMAHAPHGLRGNFFPREFFPRMGKARLSRPLLDYDVARIPLRDWGLPHLALEAKKAAYH